MKNTLILFDLAALIGAALWAVASNFEYEPVILFITLLGALIGLLVKGDELLGGSSNRAVIKGRNNTVKQTIKDSNKDQPKHNQTRVSGIDHDVDQQL